MSHPIAPAMARSQKRSQSGYWNVGKWPQNISPDFNLGEKILRKSDAKATINKSSINFMTRKTSENSHKLSCLFVECELP
jgi:hypothetical protein